MLASIVPGFKSRLRRVARGLDLVNIDRLHGVGSFQ
jgi:hypothetical protein